MVDKYGRPSFQVSQGIDEMLQPQWRELRPDLEEMEQMWLSGGQNYSYGFHGFWAIAMNELGYDEAEFDWQAFQEWYELMFG